MSLNSFIITKLAAKGLKYGFASESRLLQTLDTKFSDEYVSKKVDVGETIELRLLPRPNPWVQGRVIDPQGTEYDKVTLTVNWRNTSRVISHPELTVSAKDFMREVVKPDVRGGVREAEIQAFKSIMASSAMANTEYVGVDPANSRVWKNTMAKYRKMLGPNSDVYACLDPLTLAALADNESKLFGPERNRDEAYSKMKVLPMSAVGEFYDSVDIPVHTNGDAVHAGTATVNGAGQTGNTLTIASAGNSKVYTKGSQFYFNAPGVGNALDPEKKYKLPFPQVFTLTEDCETSAGGACVLKFEPAIVVTGSLKNLDEAPANGTTVKFLGDAEKSYPQSLLYHKEAIQFVSLRLPTLDGQGAVVANEQYKNVNMRTVHFTSWESGQSYLRYDMYTGVATPYGQHVWRLWGKPV